MERLHPLDPAYAASIARRRRQLRLPQVAVALASGLTEAAISKYETLRCPVPPHKRAAIDRALDEAERAQARQQEARAV